VPDDPAIAVRGLDVAYGAIRAVQSVDIEVPQGQITALIGSNGAGKSSTLKAIAGLVPIAGGSVEIGGADATRLSAHVRVVELGVVLIPEALGAFLTMTVRENLGLGTRVGREREARGHKGGFTLEDAFRLFPVLKERADKRAQYLSGGELKMLAIARSLLMHPQVLLIDEPSLGLAPLLVRQIFAVLRGILQEHDVSVLLVEQDTAVALELANSAYVIEQGRITTHAPVSKLRADARLRAAYLGMDAASGRPASAGAGEPGAW
jgi:branched-chain amino acid transport system ATP-binding protein